ncbi:src kinase-associated phosphoprotein 2-like [Lethenteron reissneri]|uniref:src kinase-associated phosphoprotein 2-like n=1 Tax=Lethenteron reissneri TaxID=7753 RepID=UPI002AB65F15|nr:src kinase-associated phosphoprotein 2-like [Lethenteron reissneri]
MVTIAVVIIVMEAAAAFELSAPDKRSFQFSTSTADDARSWMSYIRQVIRDLRSSVIEEEEDEDEDGGDLYDDIDPIEQVKATPPATAVHKEVAVDPIDEDIYELLPEDDDEEPVVVTRTDAAKAAQAPPPVASKPELNSATEAWDATQQYDSFYQGLWDCSADCVDELSFKRGDLVHVLSKEYDAFRWWVGEANGSVGLVPKDYLMAAYDT